MKVYGVNLKNDEYRLFPSREAASLLKFRTRNLGRNWVC